MSSDYVIQLEKCSKTTLSTRYRLRFLSQDFLQPETRFIGHNTCI